MKKTILIAGLFVLSGCGMEIAAGLSMLEGDEKRPNQLSQKLDGPSEAKEVCSWLGENKKWDKDGNVDWYIIQGTNGSLRINASCIGTPVVDLIFRQTNGSSYSKERDLKITLSQGSPKGGSIVYRNIERYSSGGYDYETSTRSSISDVRVMDNGTNELVISFKSAGKLDKRMYSSTSEHKLSFDGRLDIFLRGKKSAAFTQRSFGDYDYTGANELNFSVE